MPHSHRVVVSLSLAALVVLGFGCALLGVEEQRESFEAFARIRGTVRLAEPSGRPIVVVLLRKPESNAGEPGLTVDDHFALERPGSFAFAVSPGTFRLAAFEDRNANLGYDPGEHVLAEQPFFHVDAGETHDSIELVIPPDKSLDQRFDLRALEARAPHDQHHFSLGRFTVHGMVVDLADERFGAASGSMGMWRFSDFIFELGPGIYFLDEYDPGKIPVLFVHGVSGYPQEFSTLIEQLDRDRFQPWFYFYPSGIHLDALANHLTEVTAELQIRLGFDRMAVVAHSMGGLVSRAFVLKHWEQTRRRDIRLFVAISSPWGGSESASKVKEAPEDLIVYSWLDMDPDSEFLKGLFFQPPDYVQVQPLPPHTAFHMIFGYKRDEHSFGPSGDTVLTVKSETRLEAIEAARSILPLDYTHTGILKSAEAVDRLNRILANTF